VPQVRVFDPGEPASGAVRSSRAAPALDIQQRQEARCGYDYGYDNTHPSARGGS
jgi:hypothetical protein